MRRHSPPLQMQGRGTIHRRVNGGGVSAAVEEDPSTSFAGPPPLEIEGRRVHAGGSYRQNPHRERRKARHPRPKHRLARGPTRTIAWAKPLNALRCVARSGSRLLGLPLPTPITSPLRRAEAEQIVGGRHRPPARIDDRGVGDDHLARLRKPPVDRQPHRVRRAGGLAHVARDRRGLHCIRSPPAAPAHKARAIRGGGCAASPCARANGR